MGRRDNFDRSSLAFRRVAPSRRAALTAVLSLVAATVIGLGRITTASAADAIVKIDNFTFNPAILSVAVGTTVIWDNGDDIPHSVVATDKSFRSKALDTEDKFSFTFSKSGEYEYFCGLHPHMKGKIAVSP